MLLLLLLLHGWKGMCCHADACTVLPAEQRALMERSRHARHHECPLWASLRYNTALSLISHWINFILSANLFCDIYRSMLWSRGALQRNCCFFMCSKTTCFIIFLSFRILQPRPYLKIQLETKGFEIGPVFTAGDQPSIKFKWSSNKSLTTLLHQTLQRNETQLP